MKTAPSSARAAPLARLAIVALACSLSCCKTAHSPITTDEVCEQIHEAYAYCGGPWSTCPIETPSSCAAKLTAFSDAYVAAISSCLDSAMPGDCTGVCLAPSASGLSPSTAQSKLKTDFCAACPDGASTQMPQSCSSFFTGDGLSVLMFADDVAEQVDTTCLPLQDAGAGDCAAAFGACASAITTQASTSAAIGCVMPAGSDEADGG